MSSIEIVHSYRTLYRSALRAVKFSLPARYIVRDQLRAAFRAEGSSWDREVASRTNEFLEAAAVERGLEHKILKNLIRVAHSRSPRRVWKTNYLRNVDSIKKPLVQATKDFDTTTYNHFDVTLAMLNKSMGLALRCGPPYASH